MSQLRQATREDTAELWRVRYAVTENTLTPGRISDAELHAYLEDHGRGWVIELAPGRIAGFAIGDARDGHIWAMFVDPPLHGQGYGRLLHDVMVDWLFAQGHRRLDLGTMPDSRAEAFYRRAGWTPTDEALDAYGDKRFELRIEDWNPMLETHVIETGPNPGTTLIVLHGLGADGHDFVPICGELDLKSLGAVRFVFPHAPERPVTINGGYVMRAWYDILGTDLVKREDEAGLRESLRQVSELVDAERQRGVAAERIVLVGFSQGCAMALMTALRYPERLGGAVGLSGYLPLAATTAAERSPANADLPIFMAHGSQDPVVVPARGTASRDALQALGYAVEWHDYPMPHSVCMEEINDLNAWLLKHLG